MKSSPGEIFIACIVGAVAAFFAAAVGFVGGVFLCENLLTGEATEWVLIAGPATALIFGIAGFVFAFRKIVTIGMPKG